jgi:hypothetical protein
VLPGSKCQGASASIWQSRRKAKTSCRVSLDRPVPLGRRTVLSVHAAKATCGVVVGWVVVRLGRLVQQQPTGRAACGGRQRQGASYMRSGLRAKKNPLPIAAVEVIRRSRFIQVYWDSVQGPHFTYESTTYLDILSTQSALHVKSTASFESLDNQRTAQINSPAATRIGDAFLVDRRTCDES